MESVTATNLRTEAASGVAAKYLARPDATTATIFGAGTLQDAAAALAVYERPSPPAKARGFLFGAERPSEQ